MPSFQSLIHKDGDNNSGKRKAEEQPESRDLKRISLASTVNENSCDSSRLQALEVWMVQWRNYQYKKHKTWDGDAVLAVTSKSEAMLYACDGTLMLTEKATKALPLFEGKNLHMGSKEIELDRQIPREQFLSGVCFGRYVNVEAATTGKASYNDLKSKFNTPSFKAPKVTVNVKGSKSESGTRVSSLDIQPEIRTTSPNLSEISTQTSCWTANWRKPQGKKNKTWDGDAYISLTEDKLVMISEDGKIMGSTTWKGQTLASGFTAIIGGKEVELDMAIPSSQLPDTAAVDELNFDRISVPEAVKNPVSEMKPKPYVAPTNFYANSSPKPKFKVPLHDPEAPEALVMKAPTKEHIKKFNKRNLAIVPVVVDPILSRRMRPHQKEGKFKPTHMDSAPIKYFPGVSFLYECVMGLRKHEGQGCILADEMGLGKTLQTISLIWTLLKQNPYAAPLPTMQKVLIVCPVSLVNNWKAEFHKWLGRDRVGVLTCDKNNSAIDLFGRSKVHEVLIIGYERLRTVIDKLSNIYPPIGLIICDEGHRLKSANNRTTAMFKALNTRRRIILSGTPIQNDLGEFHAMAEFCNPGLLDDYSVFRKVYETPILKSRAPDATASEIETGEARTIQLLSVAKSFVLRRDTSLLKNHLPPKSEFVVFITPTPIQLEMFSKILNPTRLDDLIQNSTAESLALINILTKISNSPILLKATADSIKGRAESLPSMQQASVLEALNLLRDKTNIADISLSGKLIVLAKMLRTLRQNTSEKCVLVSHYTSTLNILETYCRKMAYSYFRLDGQTPQNKRQEFVNAFNAGNQHNGFIFLLSSKAGGVGINLIGASRLFLIDSDWNPSHDLQSMARCHRDGQKRPVFIYRLLTAGAIDEKIYQRQVTKLALSESLIGSGSTSSKGDSFTRKDLRDIFRIHPDTTCNTHDLLECLCDNSAPMDGDDNDDNGPVIDSEKMQKGGFICASDVPTTDPDSVEKTYLQKKKAELAALSEWKHINCLKSSAVDLVQDDILRRVITISFDKASSPAATPKPEQSRLDNLLASVDLETIQAMDKSCSPLDFPGGTISFVFEKQSKTNLDDVGT